MSATPVQTLSRFLGLLLACCLVLGVGMAADGESEITDLKRQIRVLQQKKAAVLRDLRNGLFCSECKRSKTEIEQNENFENHLRSVKGKPVPASPELMRAKADEIDAQIERLEGQIDAINQRVAREFEARNRERQEENRRQLQALADQQEQARQQALVRQQQEKQRKFEDLRNHLNTAVGDAARNIQEMMERRQAEEELRAAEEEAAERERELKERQEQLERELKERQDKLKREQQDESRAGLFGQSEADRHLQSLSEADRRITAEYNARLEASRAAQLAETQQRAARPFGNEPLSNYLGDGGTPSAPGGASVPAQIAEDAAARLGNELVADVLNHGAPNPDRVAGNAAVGAVDGFARGLVREFIGSAADQVAPDSVPERRAMELVDDWTDVQSNFAERNFGALPGLYQQLRDTWDRFITDSVVRPYEEFKP